MATEDAIKEWHERQRQKHEESRVLLEDAKAHLVGRTIVDMLLTRCRDQVLVLDDGGLVEPASHDYDSQDTRCDYIPPDQVEAWKKENL